MVKGNKNPFWYKMSYFDFLQHKTYQILQKRTCGRFYQETNVVLLFHFNQLNVIHIRIYRVNKLCQIICC